MFFEYRKKGLGSSSIIYDVDLDALMKTAYNKLGYVDVERNSDKVDEVAVLVLKLTFSNEEGLVRKNTKVLKSLE